MSACESNTILVVDDDSAVRRLTATILMSNGYDVIEADCGPEGLARFAEYRNRVKLVLSDIVMPNMTGTEMVAKILALAPSMRVMLMTGWAMGSKVPDAVPVLAKPFTPPLLLQAIRACLAGHAPVLNAI